MKLEHINIATAVQGDEVLVQLWDAGQVLEYRDLKKDFPSETLLAVIMLFAG